MDRHESGLMGPGAFAEFRSVPAYCCFKIPEQLNYEEGVLVEPISVGVHTPSQL